MQVNDTAPAEQMCSYNTLTLNNENNTKQFIKYTVN